jgi:hypothetical protein
VYRVVATTTQTKPGRMVEFTFGLQRENRPVTRAGYNCLRNSVSSNPLEGDPL